MQAQDETSTHSAGCTEAVERDEATESVAFAEVHDTEHTSGPSSAFTDNRTPYVLSFTVVSDDFSAGDMTVEQALMTYWLRFADLDYAATAPPPPPLSQHHTVTLPSIHEPLKAVISALQREYGITPLVVEVSTWG